MEKIRIQSGIQIEVNDNGDTISLNVDDQKFIDRYFELLEMLEQACSEIPKLRDENASTKDVVNWEMKTMTSISDRIDILFGADSCKKVFGDIVPSPFVLADFFDQLTPIIKKYADERNKRISGKYNRTRKGGASV